MERNSVGTATYLEATTRLLVSPGLRQVEDGVTLPDCYFWSSTLSCTATEVVVRHAFARRDPLHPYMALETSSSGQSEFGVATTTRLLYDRDFGITVSGTRQLAHRMNLYGAWTRYARDEATARWMAGERGVACPGLGAPCRHTDDDTPVPLRGRPAVTSDDVPEEVAQSGDATNLYYCRSDLDPYSTDPCFFVHDGASVFTVDASADAPIPFRPFERPLAPVAYHLAPGFPEALLPSARKVVDQWNDVLLQTVWLAAGCPPDGFADRLISGCGTRPELANPHFRMMVLCESSPVASGDPAACGAPGREIRLGDVRHHHLVWVDPPHQSSPLGYGPALASPLSGEIRSASAYVYGAVLELQAAQVAQWVEMQTNSNFDWTSVLVGRIPGEYRSVGGTYNEADIQAGYRAMDSTFVTSVQGSAGLPAGRPASAAEIQTWLAARLQAVSDSGALGSGAAQAQSRIDRLRDGWVEDQMLTPGYLRSQAARLASAGLDGANVTLANLPPGSSVRREVSPLTRHNVSVLGALNLARAAHQARHVLYPGSAPLRLRGRAAELVCGLCCADSDRVDGTCPEPTSACIDDVDSQAARWFDDPQCGARIRVRARELLFQHVALHELGHNLGLRHNFKGSYDALNYFDDYWGIRKQDGTVLPRVMDPVTSAEDRALPRFETSSIMDLGGLWGSDDPALGRWDVAAVHHSYAGFRQVFDQVNDQDGMAFIQAGSGQPFPRPVRLWLGAAPETLHYTRYHHDPALLQQGIVDTSEANRSWVPEAWITDVYPIGGQVYRTDNDVEILAGNDLSRVQVPYLFCADEVRGRILGCDAHDQGADPFEIGEATLRSYYEDYWFNNFAWDRYAWGSDTDAYASLILERYFEPLRRMAGQYVLLKALISDWGLYSQAQIDSLFTDAQNGWGGFTLAVVRGFEALVRTLTTVQPGGHTFDPRTGNLTPDPFGVCPLEPDCPYVGEGGRLLDDVYSPDHRVPGQVKQTVQGQFTDRVLAIQSLAESTSPWVYYGGAIHTPDLAINYSRVFPDHIGVMFAAIASNDLDVIAPSYCGQDGNGMAIVEQRDITALWRPRCSLTGGTFQGLFVFGNTFEQQLYAASLGMALFPTHYSRWFLEVSRIYVAGSLDQYDLPPEAEIAQFVDPFTYKRYLAVRYPDVDLGDGSPPSLFSTSIAAQMLDDASDLKASYLNWQTEFDLTGDATDYENMVYYRDTLERYAINLELMRGLGHTYEYLTE